MGKEKPPRSFDLGGFRLKPGSDLLWHARRAHYHRRRAFSLPSSEWDRVVPARYCHQANFWLMAVLAYGHLPNPVSFLSERLSRSSTWINSTSHQLKLQTA